MIWLVFVVLAMAAAFAVFHGTQNQPAELNSAAAIFKSQLEELEREKRDGLIGAEEARAAKLEIERRLAATLRQSPGSVRYTKPRSLLIGASLLVMGTSLGLYAQLGRPDLAPSPTVQSETPTPEGVDAMIAKLEQRLQATPGDAEGWRMLGWAQTRLQRFDRAVAAYEKALSLEPDNSEFKSATAEALTLAAGQIVSPRARALFEDVLKLDPKDSMAAYYLGIADEQAGAFDAAFDRWHALAQNPDVNDTNREIIRRHVIAMGEKTGRDVRPTLVLLDKPTPAPAPTQNDMDQIDSMIAGLAQKLADQPDNLEGWKMLIRSLHVRQGEMAANDAYVQAQKIFATRDDALQELKSLRDEIGF